MKSEFLCDDDDGYNEDNDVEYNDVNDADVYDRSVSVCASQIH